ncbi:MAG TPA: hypothetical protein VK013_10810 [Myxococcaceae bacterium]|nr:hypothetical protein [Myxococcaceae bacterium]
MSLLPESASFEERVVDCFCALRGGGVGISALDRPVLERWAASGVPFEVVARGLRLAAQKAGYDAIAGLPALSTLRAAGRTVDAEIRRFLKASAGAHRPALPSSGDAWARKRRDSVLASLGTWVRRRPELSGQAERLSARLAAEPPDAVWVEDLSALTLLRALPFAERQGLWRRAGADSAGMSPASRRIARRTRLFALLSSRLDGTP